MVVIVISNQIEAYYFQAMYEIYHCYYEQKWPINEPYQHHELVCLVHYDI